MEYLEFIYHHWLLTTWFIMLLPGKALIRFSLISNSKKDKD